MFRCLKSEKLLQKVLGPEDEKPCRNNVEDVGMSRSFLMKTRVKR